MENVDKYIKDVYDDEDFKKQSLEESLENMEIQENEETKRKLIEEMAAQARLD